MQDRSSVAVDQPRAGWRVGEVAERLGVSPSTIRLWEERYGLPTAARTPGGHRRYSEDDVEQLTALRDLVERGHALGRGGQGGGGRAAVLETVLAATRAVLRARTVREVTHALVAYVRVAGGDVIEAGRAGAGAMAFDLSFGEGEPLLVIAGQPSVARFRIEQALPALLEDARRIVALLRNQGGA